MEGLAKNSAVILLAAGKGSRAGMPKGLIEVEGRPWIERQIEALKRAGVHKVVVVLGEGAGHGRDAYERILHPHLKGSGLATAVNREPDRGVFSSIQTGIGAVLSGDPSISSAWVLPVDVPCPSRAVWQRLEEEASLRGSDAALPTHHGKGGHPVRLSRTFAEKLLTLSPLEPESRLDHQIHKLSPAKVSRIEVGDSGVLANLNGADDFKRHAM